MPSLHRQFYGVEQVVVHLAGPLAVAGVEELLAVAGRAAEVDLKHGVAAVREPLRVAGCSPRRRAPHGPAVDEQHRGQLLGGHAGRRRDVAVDLHAIASGEFDRLHLRQLVLFQRGSCANNSVAFFDGRS